MRILLKLGAIATGLALGGTVQAQQTSTSGLGNTTSSTTTSTGNTSTSSTSSGSIGSSTPTTNQSITVESAPTISALPVGGTASALNSSNIFGGYYNNPYYQGRAGQDGKGAPGGFGASLYGTGSTGSTSNSIRSGTTGATGTSITSRTGTTGTTGTAGTTGRTGTGIGGTTGTGGFGVGGQGTNTATQNLGQIVALPRNIAYTATLRFSSPTLTPAKMHTDVKAALERSTMIANAKGIEAVLGDGNVIILRGNVKDDDDRRLVEGLVRLTPGVRDVKNELVVKP